MTALDIPNADRGDIDPITAEVLRYTMLAIPKQVDTNITKTAYSPLIYEYKDYAVGLVDHQGRLIAQGGGGAPIFIANALGVAVEDGLNVLGEDNIEAGDIILTNHSGTLGQHLNNVVAYTPIVWDGRIFAYMACVVHWLDLGGAIIGSCTSPVAVDIFQEGIQLRQVKLWSRGKLDKGLHRSIEANTRMPRELLGDIDAQVAGCLHGRDLFVEVLAKYGASTVRRAIDLMWDRSEAAARAVVGAIPDGDYCAESLLDCDPAVPGVPVPVRVKIEVRGDDFTIDYAGTAAQAKGAINSGREGGAVAAARIAFKYLASPSESANHGTFRPLKVSIPDGTFLSADERAPMGQYSTVLPTVIDTILKAMTSVLPDRMAGGHHGAMEGIRFSGVDARTGELFLYMDTCLGGWGASAGCDGPGPYKTMVHGDTLEVPVEPVEQFYPIRIESYELRPDSGGPGEFRGGNGVEKVFVALQPCDVMLVLDRVVCPAWGVLGGADALSSEGYLERAGRPPRPIGHDTVRLEAGDRVRIRTGGGGGYGEPRLRDPQSVADDVRAGYVTRATACEVYGVALDEAGSVLAKETSAMRSAPIAAKPGP